MAGLMFETVKTCRLRSEFAKLVIEFGADTPIFGFKTGSTSLFGVWEKGRESRRGVDTAPES